MKTILLLMSVTLLGSTSEGLRPLKTFAELPEAPPLYTAPVFRYLFAHQWFHIGVNGELFPPPDYVMPPDEALIVVPQGEVTELRLLSSFDEAQPFAVITANGEVKRTDSAKTQLQRIETQESTDLPAFPHQWPRLDNGHLAMPPATQVLARSGGDSSAKAIPAGAVGWLAQSILPGYLIFPAEGMEAPENVLWILPLDAGAGVTAGFSLVHSGPLREGVYFTVDSSGEIHIGDGGTGLEKFQTQENWWPYRDADNGLLTVDVDGWAKCLFGLPPRTQFLYRDNMPVSATVPDFDL